MKGLKFKNKALNFNESLFMEKYLLEAKEDKQKFIDKFGQEIYDRFMELKQRIKNVELEDGKKASVDLTYHTKHTSPKEMEEILDRAENREYQKGKKIRKGIGNETIPDPTNTKEKVFEDGPLTMWFITDAEDMMDIGGDAGWCIGGRYTYFDEPPGMVKPSQANQFFYSYLNYTNGGYYVLIDAEKELYENKYCILIQEDGSVNSIWNKMDAEEDAKEFFVWYPSVLEWFEENIDGFSMKVSFNEDEFIEYIKDLSDFYESGYAYFDLISALPVITHNWEMHEELWGFADVYDTMQEHRTASDFIDVIEWTDISELTQMMPFKINEETKCDNVEDIIKESCAELIERFCGDYYIAEVPDDWYSDDWHSYQHDNIETRRIEIRQDNIFIGIDIEDLCSQARQDFEEWDSVTDASDIVDSWADITRYDTRYDIGRPVNESDACVYLGADLRYIEVSYYDFLMLLLNEIFEDKSTDDIKEAFEYVWYENMPEDVPFDLF